MVFFAICYCQTLSSSLVINQSNMAEPIGEGHFEVQNICVGNIDPVKLMDKLELKFRSQFKVNIMHNVYSIRAPRLLSPKEIEDCR